MGGVALRAGEPWPERGVTFSTRKGSFTIAKGLRDRDPDAFAYQYASHLPDGVTSVSSRVEGDVEVFTWRMTRTVAA